MVINLIDNSINTNYKGRFEQITTNIKQEVDRTNFYNIVLDMKKEHMDDNRLFIENLRLLIVSRFENDIELFARSIGTTPEQIQNFLEEGGDPPRTICGELEKNKETKKGDNIQIGDKVIEINSSGDGMTNNFEGILKGSQIELIKRMKMEIADLKKIMKEKDRLIDLQDEMIKSLKKE